MQITINEESKNVQPVNLKGINSYGAASTQRCSTYLWRTR